MAITKTIVCLANSRKVLGRCVAGKESRLGRSAAWIRPVSDRKGEEVSRDERVYANGHEPRVLDIVDVPLIEPRPSGFQTENWLLNSQEEWILRGRFAIDSIPTLMDRPDSLWPNGHKTFHGLNDQVPENLAGALTVSLYLIPADAVDLHVFAPGANFGDHKRRVQARFEYRDVPYWLRVTDPTIEDEFLAKPDGEYLIGAACLTVSLAAESYKGSHYKLVAAIIPVQATS